MTEEREGLIIRESLESAREEGILSDEAMEVLERAGGADQLRLPAGQEQVVNYRGSSIYLSTALIDDSYSMHSRSYEETVRIGHRAVIDALKGAHNADSIWFQTWFLNQGLVHPFTPIEGAPVLDATTYNPGGSSTPLFMNTAKLLGEVIALSQSHRDRYGEVTTATLIVTDGEDNEGGLSGEDVSKIVTDMEQTGIHLICAMAIEGYEDGPATKALLSMGIRREWILNPGSTPDQIRAAFRRMAKAAVLASKSETLTLLLNSGKGFESEDLQSGNGGN